MKENNRKSTFPAVLLALAALVGLGCSIYLTQHFYEIRNGTASFKSACNVSLAMNCDIVAASKYAEFFGGLPLSAIAAGWYLALLAVAVMTQVGDLAREAKRAALAMSLVAAVSSIYYFALMAGILHTYCLFCLVIDGANLLIFVSALLMKPEAPSKAPLNWGQLRNLSFIALGGLVVAVVLLKAYDTTQASAISNDERAQSILSSRAVSVGSGAEYASMGNASAPITIVEFSDFECPFCRIAALTLHAVMDRYPGKVHVVYRSFPLSSECNSKFPQTMHPYACEAARVAVCAQKQGKFQEVYETLFENQAKFAHGIPTELAKQAGADPAQLSLCISSTEANLEIQKDVAEGSQLGVESTPTLFFNGHKIDGALPLDLLSKMIDVTLGTH